mmetsp:Transcript_23083/g.39464  ORF Transcript_23083/g.39464 Transcript_23083/m.39464 type:complete len:140 (+) Transcript_23083:105-524(+)
MACDLSVLPSANSNPLSYSIQSRSLVSNTTCIKKILYPTLYKVDHLYQIQYLRHVVRRVVALRAPDNNTTVLTSDFTFFSTTRLPLQATLGQGFVKTRRPSSQDGTCRNGKDKEEDLHRRDFCKALSVFLNVKVAVDSL